MGMLMTCGEAVAALSDYADGVLPLNPFLKVRVHLFNCPGCRVLLATLRALPGLAACALDAEDSEGEARRALAGALARLGEAQPRAWARTPVPDAARRLLEGDPDLPMRILAFSHALITRERGAPVRPYGLPQATLDRLPDPALWRWEEGRNGARKTELALDPRGGQRLLLVFAPPDSTLPPHRHLGSESMLVLCGSMTDQGREFGRGDWVHHPEGSCHAPRVAASGCWCLIRQEGAVHLLGPAGWRRRLSHAS